MSRIRGKNTGPELALRRALWSRGIRYRVKSRLPGRPDIVFPGKRTAVFVDGCFWHGCPKHAVRPKSNSAFWESKLAQNVARDARVTDELERLGWIVLRIWEHEIEQALVEVADRIAKCVK